MQICVKGARSQEWEQELEALLRGLWLPPERESPPGTHLPEPLARGALALHPDVSPVALALCSGLGHSEVEAVGSVHGGGLQSSPTAGPCPESLRTDLLGRWLGGVPAETTQRAAPRPSAGESVAQRWREGASSPGSGRLGEGVLGRRADRREATPTGTLPRATLWGRRRGWEQSGLRPRD